MKRSTGSEWKSEDKLESYVRDRLTSFGPFFQNHMGRYLPQMEATIPGQFNRSGHGIDILALDSQRTLWIIEVSRGRTEGAGLTKSLDLRKKGGAQMSPEWRVYKNDQFLALPDARQKLAALFDIPVPSEENARELMEVKLRQHRVAIVVPAGCHVQGSNTGLSFGDDVYTFFSTMR